MNKYILRLNKIYNYLFKEKFYKKIKINWGDYPNRTEIIQKIIDLKEFKSYLEIGCDDDINFDKVKINSLSIASNKLRFFRKFCLAFSLTDD